MTTTEDAADPLAARTRPEPSWGPAWLIVLAVLGALLAWSIGRLGVITPPDGIVYTGVASNLAEGRGLTAPFSGYTDHYAPGVAAAFGTQVPLVHWPPLYPLVLAGMQLVGLTATAAAAVLNPILFGLNIYLLGRLTQRLYDPRWSYFFVALLVLVLFREPESFVLASLVTLHASALAEPLFTTFALSVLLLLDRHLSDGDDRWFWAAAMAASLATATRFNGVPLVLVVAAVGAVRGPWRTRALRAGGSMAVGLLPSAYWLLSAREGRMGRPPDGLRSAATELGNSMSAMLASPSWPSLVRSALVLGTCVALVVTLSAALRNEHTRRRLARLSPALFVAVLMILQLVFTRGFVDRNIQVNGRQMAVVHLLLAMTVIGLAAITVQRRVLTQIWVGVLALTAVWAGAGPVGRLVVDPLPPARSDDVVAAVSRIPRDQVVFTNAPDLIYQATGRSAHLVPCPTNFFSGLPRIEYEREIAELAELVRSGDGSIILFDVWLGRPGECGNIDAIRQQPSLKIDQESGSTVISGVN